MNKELFDAAKKVMENSYSPYSKYKVGCSIKLKNGKIFTGCNVENASYGATICAERSALVSLVSAGENPQEIEEILIIANTETIPIPCFMCRQVLVEFCHEDVLVTFTTQEQNYQKVTLKELTPYIFRF